MTTSLYKAQLEMAAFLRDPAGANPPANIEARRLQVYRDLVYRNIEGFISSAFPVLRSLYDDATWEARVRGFIQTHRCETPLFLRISEEFLAFLSALEEDAVQPFEAELAHYEWLELAVDVVDADVPARLDAPTLDGHAAFLAPTARLASYRFPVHRIGPSFQPREADTPTFLLVYRDRENQVQFLELSAASARLTQEVGASEDPTTAALFERLSTDWGVERTMLDDFAWKQLLEFHESGIVGFAATAVR